VADGFLAVRLSSQAIASLGDLGGVGVHPIQQDLHGDRPPAGAELGEVVRQDHADVELSRTERLPEGRGGRIDAGQPERPVLRQDRDELAALRGAAVVHDAQAHVAHLGVQREPEEQDLHRGRQDQRDHEAPVAPDLAELLQHERPEASPEGSPEASNDEAAHALTCMRRIVRHASP
jgi:hypothetical protein